MTSLERVSTCFFFHDPTTTKIYTLSLHDALPICDEQYQSPKTQNAVHDNRGNCDGLSALPACKRRRLDDVTTDRKSTRLNSSHVSISYAVFCLKKKTSNYYDQINVRVAAALTQST